MDFHDFQIGSDLMLWCFSTLCLFSSVLFVVQKTHHGFHALHPAGARLLTDQPKYQLFQFVDQHKCEVSYFTTFNVLKKRMEPFKKGFKNLFQGLNFGAKNLQWNETKLKISNIQKSIRNDAFSNPLLHFMVVAYLHFLIINQ